MDKNETLETLELKDLDCSAIFHRTKQILNRDNNANPAHNRRSPHIKRLLRTKSLKGVL
jgi:hypothetical protein